MHDTLTIGLPLFAILAGILLNKSEVKELRSEMRDGFKEVRVEIKELRKEMDRRFDAVDAELRYFHGTIGKLEARVDLLEKNK